MKLEFSTDNHVLADERQNKKEVKRMRKYEEPKASVINFEQDYVMAAGPSPNVAYDGMNMEIENSIDIPGEFH